MDEPISGLDPKQIVEIHHLIKILPPEHTVTLSPVIYFLKSNLYAIDFLFLQEGKLVYDYSRTQLEEEMQNFLYYKLAFKHI